MKKILVINGSPKKERSATMHVTNAFLKGFSDSEYTKEILHIVSYNIKTCMGCLACCSRTNGVCVIKDDDIPMIRSKIEEADIIILSFPIYFFGLPGKLKMAMDRLLGMINACDGLDNYVEGKPLHGFRNSVMTEKKLVLISSCGWVNTNLIYEPTVKQFDLICGKGNFTPLFCAEVKTLADQGMRPRMVKYLKNFEQAGSEYAKNLSLSNDTIKSVTKPPYSDAVYPQLLQMYWEQEKKAGENS